MSASRLAPACLRLRRRRGSMVMEFAFCVALLFMLLAPMLMLSRSLLFYNLLLRATRDAAHHIAAAPPAAMASDEQRKQIIATARAMVIEAVAVTSGRLKSDTNVKVLCDGDPCDGGASMPAPIRLSYQLELTNDVLGEFLFDFNNGYGLTLKLDVTVPYEN